MHFQGDQLRVLTKKMFQGAKNIDKKNFEKKKFLQCFGLKNILQCFGLKIQKVFDYH